MDKQIKVEEILEQVKIGMDDEMQDYVNLDYAGKGLKLLDYAIQNNIREQLHVDDYGDLYLVENGHITYA